VANVPGVATLKLKTVDAFVVIDLDDAPVSTGIVRRAPKVLPSGAADLARTITYTYASLGMPRGGASAGISAPDDGADAAVAAFAAEIEPLVAAGTFLPDTGKGVTEVQLAPLRAADPRAPLPDRTHHRLVAAGAVAAAEHAVGALDGRRVAIEGYDEAGRQLVGELIERGAIVVAVSTPAGTVRDDAGLSPFELAKGAGIVGEGAEAAVKVLGADCDVLFAGSKMGAIDHTGAAFVTAKAVVPTGAIPVTAKALAVLRRQGTVVLPDFVVLAGPLLAAWGEPATDSAAIEAQVRETIAGILAEVFGHADGPLLGACERAEAFLRSWRAALPFGRPLAA
jgi:glutamate dehydrogenase/leucine dehydrogenase